MSQIVSSLRCLVAFLLLAGAGAQAGQGDAGPPPDRPVLHTLFVPAEGWAYQDESGRLTGVTVEIMRAFAAWLGTEHSLQPRLEFEAEQDWSVFYARVRAGSGSLFGLGNVTITDQRAEELAFSPPYLQNVAVLISPATTASEVQPDTMASDFEGLRALAFADTLHEQRLRALGQDYWPDLVIDRAGSNQAILEAVAAGTHFAYLDVYNVYRAREQGMALQRHPAFDDPGETFGIIMPLDNPWRDELQAFFQADGGLMQRRWYADLLAHHLGSRVAELLVPSPPAE